ncbi:DUF2750 domain-containing protein [Alginatibacterium sediminis]|uniref:DUF2750 domain-containing protein n=1 Tax=Alginatibacterium sediminis TaxID=2164068 RepID=A0A420E5Z1_9ALTE|nr:DUF2750 domain-containing protein [Alginatibacterium sediminis]RKF13269.1 DUF2750 domain-containing protein [Alginatibacterium sediminis]
MSDIELSTSQISAIESMSDQVRYDYLISQMKNQGKVWTLADDEGCLMVHTGQENALVLFSHEQLAQLWAKQDHPQCKPLMIDFEVFVQKWLPGMQADEHFVALLPNLNGDSLLESAEDFAQNF